jgi:PIN domain nuclease of toxin-antitoxin system
MTLWEIAQLASSGSTRIASGVDEILSSIEDNPSVAILPLTVDVVREAAHLRHILRDPADCIIAATARVHGLRLLTSDQRIIASNVVSTIE